MSIRNNEDRTGAKNPHTAGESPPDLMSQMKSGMDFVTPTEYVDLPSKGRGYPPGHPLHGKDTIEIKFMTAKDEDILTSRSLLKKGVALDKLISNLIVDPNIKAEEMLMGDRNSIIINARASAYGSVYETTVTCPSCGEQSKQSFDLKDPTIYHGDEHEDYVVQAIDNGNWLVQLPISGLIVEAKLLRGKDEAQILKRIKKQNKNQPDSMITDQMRSFIVGINGDTSAKVIDYFVNNLVVQESRYLRNAFKAITPDLKISDDFECPSCGHEQELEVPFGADFFWPDR